METIITNKNANFEYFITQKLFAGIQLMGTEVKSIRDRKASLSEAYCNIYNGEIFIKKMHVSEYRQIKHTNHEPLRDRKLLLNKREINKLEKAVKEKGLTIIPLNIMLTNTGFIKIEIGLAKGKKLYDKKNQLKLNDLNKELRKEIF